MYGRIMKRFDGYHARLNKRQLRPDDGRDCVFVGRCPNRRLKLWVGTKCGDYSLTKPPRYEKNSYKSPIIKEAIGEA